MNYITLSNGIKMPVLGYGVYQVTKEDAERCVSDALEVGSGQTHVNIFCFKSLNYYLKNAQNGKIPLGWNYAFKRKSGRNRRF